MAAFPSRQSRARRSSPIHAYVGPNGGGKTLAMVLDTIPSLQRGRAVLSTVTLLDPKTKDAHPLFTPLIDFRQLLEARHCDVLLDEVTGVASSRTSASLPPQVANLLVQLRRRDVVLRWTSPAWARADVIIREVTQQVTYCRGFVPKRSPGREWGANRLMLWRTYDAASFEDFTSAKRDKLDTLGRQFFWRPALSRLDTENPQLFYDTLDQVFMLGAVSDSGTCVVCGGRRTAPKCDCGPLLPDEDLWASSGREDAPGPVLRLRAVRPENAPQAGR